MTDEVVGAPPTPPPTEPAVEPPAPPAAVEEPAPPVATKDAGLAMIRAGINLISTHSAASIAGSIIGDALKLLQDGYNILTA